MDSPFHYIAVAMAGVCAAFGLYLLGKARMADRLVRMMESEITIREKVLLGPDYVPAFTDARWFGVKRSGSVVLTDKKLLFCPAIGKASQIPIQSIKSVRSAKSFAGNYRYQYPFVILQLGEDQELGFQVKNRDEWHDAIKSRLKQ